MASQSILCPVCHHVSQHQGQQMGAFALATCPHCTLRFAPEAFGIPVNYDDVYKETEYQADQVKTMRECLNPVEFARIGTYLEFFHRVPPWAGARLLDVGCGVGRFCHAAKYHGWDVTGIDISQTAIAVAKAFATFPVKVCTLEEEIAKQPYDVITAFELVEHLSNPIDFMTQVRHGLTPLGHFFCTVPNWDCQQISAAIRRDWLPPVHLLFFTRRALDMAARLCGFREIATGFIDGRSPKGWRPRVQWLPQCLRRTKDEPLGLWMHARV